MEETPKQPEKDFRGLYRHVKITVPTLNLIIIGGIAAIILVLFIGLQNPGFTVSFDTNGGTHVESQKLMYGDTVTPPEPPTREGYRFVGWYRDLYGTYEWHMETDQVSEPMTLYAIWEKIE